MYIHRTTNDTGVLGTHVVHNLYMYVLVQVGLDVHV